MSSFDPWSMDYSKLLTFYDSRTDTRGKHSWIAGLDNCPKCKSDVRGKRWYCEKCGYGEKQCVNTKPPTIKGYDYIQNKDYPEGKYLRKADKSLFKTVIIESYKKQMIAEALGMVEHADLIFNKWGFSETVEKGRGVSLLFWGPPGTGKTLMGEAIANYLGKKLAIVTAADILNMYVGESEQRIAKTFRDHKDDVILFDECDSLLRSRDGARASWEVSQVNVLLHELEQHQGVTIFTTNHITNLDKAFERRLALRVHFEMPDVSLREQIWQRMFPKKAPLAKDIDWGLLANFEISGGYIKNAVLRAARLAAFNGKKEIDFTTIKMALKQELEAINEYQTGKSGLPDERKQVKTLKPALAE